MKHQTAAMWSFWKNDLKFSRRLTLLGFVLVIAITFVVGLLMPAIPQKVMSFFSSFVADAGIMDDEGNFSALAIFGNNIRAMLVTVCCGFLPFIFLPAFSLCLNAALLGLFAAQYVNAGQSLWVYLAGILPHGIFELPAIVIAAACGFYLCNTLTDYVRHNPQGVVKPALLNLVRVFLIVIFPLLVAAAVVEAHVTPAVMAYIQQILS